MLNPMEKDHNELGRWGEDTAVAHLEAKGYTILQRNYRHHYGEIDIIARSTPFLVFIEVKTRTNLSFGMPESFVDRTKARLITNTAEEYTFRTNWQGPIRFDVVAIIKQSQNIRIRHFEDAFY
jgi:putative endonuclease